MKPLSPLEVQVIQLVEVEGKTFEEVEATLNIDQLAAVTAYWRVKKRRERNLMAYWRVKKRRERNQKTDPSNPFYGLNIRATSCCRYFNLQNREQVQLALRTGKLRPGMHDYGKVRHAEVCAWAGMTPPMLVKGRPVVCPHCGGAL